MLLVTEQYPQNTVSSEIESFILSRVPRPLLDQLLTIHGRVPVIFYSYALGEEPRLLIPYLVIEPETVNLLNEIVSRGIPNLPYVTLLGTLLKEHYEKLGRPLILYNTLLNRFEIPILLEPPNELLLNGRLTLQSVLTRGEEERLRRVGEKLRNIFNMFEIKTSTVDLIEQVLRTAERCFFPYYSTENPNIIISLLPTIAITRQGSLIAPIEPVEVGKVELSKLPLAPTCTSEQYLATARKLMEVTGMLSTILNIAENIMNNIYAHLSSLKPSLPVTYSGELFLVPAQALLEVKPSLSITLQVKLSYSGEIGKRMLTPAYTWRTTLTLSEPYHHMSWLTLPEEEEKERHFRKLLPITFLVAGLIIEACKNPQLVPHLDYLLELMYPKKLVRQGIDYSIMLRNLNNYGQIYDIARYLRERREQFKNRGLLVDILMHQLPISNIIKKIIDTLDKVLSSQEPIQTITIIIPETGDILPIIGRREGNMAIITLPRQLEEKLQKKHIVLPLPS